MLFLPLCILSCSELISGVKVCRVPLHCLSVLLDKTNSRQESVLRCRHCCSARVLTMSFVPKRKETCKLWCQVAAQYLLSAWTRPLRSPSLHKLVLIGSESTLYGVRKSALISQVTLIYYNMIGTAFLCAVTKEILTSKSTKVTKH